MNGARNLLLNQCVIKSQCELMTHWFSKRFLAPFLAPFFFLILLQHPSLASDAQSLNSAGPVFLDFPEDRQFDYLPLRYYFNAGFDVGQNRDFFSTRHYWSAHGTLYKRIRDPFHSIERDGGAKKFFKDEFLSDRVVPNIILHGVGGGMDFRLLYEWFENRGASYPRLLAVLTSYSSHFGNEAIELSNQEISSHDHIADLFFFDIIGKIAFTNDHVAHFFYDRLGARLWQGQAVYDFNEQRILNASVNYLFRPELVENSRFRPVIIAGIQILGGVSYEWAKDQFITLASGVFYTNPIQKDGRLVTALHYDEAGVQRASIQVNTSDHLRLRLNVFPGLLFPNDHFGFFLGETRKHDLAIGISWRMPLMVPGTFY